MKKSRNSMLSAWLNFIYIYIYKGIGLQIIWNLIFCFFLFYIPLHYMGFRLLHPLQTIWRHLIDFLPSQNLTQDCFIVKSHAWIKTYLAITFGVPQAPSNKLSPAKQVQPGQKILWNQANTMPCMFCLFLL